MTEPAPQTPPAVPAGKPRKPRVKWGACRVCGQWKPLAAKGVCWADYARPRRQAAGAVPRRIRPGDPRAATLDALTAAYNRVTHAETDAKTPLATLKGYAVGAYKDGLTYEQVADLTGRSPMTIHSWVPSKASRSPGGPRAPEEVVARWRPLLAAARGAADAAEEESREFRAQFREQLADATRDDNPGRVGLARIAGRLEVKMGTVQAWLDPRQKGAPRGHRRCVGVRSDGQRCETVARVGRETCWNHRAQEPS
jgi:hypothetical protein